MPMSSFTREQALALLALAPERIAALTAGLTPAQLRAAPAPDAWSANDVLAHLRSCSDVWGGCISAILAEDGLTFRAINPTAWIKQTDYLELEFAPSFSAFSAQRADLLAILDALPRADWARMATVTGAGKPLTRTVLAYTERLAIHERQHYRQIGQIANTMRAMGR